MSSGRFHARASEILEEFEIPLRDTTQIVATLTSAQRGLLALAMALIRRPRLLLLDEPTAALGTAETADVERLLERVRRAGIAVVLATRDIRQIYRIADRIVVLRNGRVVAQIEPSSSSRVSPSRISVSPGSVPIAVGMRRATSSMTPSTPTTGVGMIAVVPVWL